MTDVSNTQQGSDTNMTCPKCGWARCTVSLHDPAWMDCGRCGREFRPAPIVETERVDHVTVDTHSVSGNAEVTRRCEGCPDPGLPCAGCPEIRATPMVAPGEEYEDCMGACGRHSRCASYQSGWLAAMTRVRQIIEGAAPKDLWPDINGTHMDAISRADLLAALDEGANDA